MIDFEFHSPSSLEAVLDLLESHGEDARLIAGGTALVLQMKQRFAQPGHVIGLRQLAGTDGLGAMTEIDGALRIGSLCTLKQLEDDALLRAAYPHACGDSQPGSHPPHTQHGKPPEGRWSTAIRTRTRRRRSLPWERLWS